MKKPKSPSVLFYTSDFLIGTTLFTDEEVGQYIKLLCYQHQLGHLSPSFICRICGDLSSPVLAKFDIDSEGNYFNFRMEEEIQKRNNYSESRKKNINKRYNNKTPSTYVATYVPRMKVHMDNDNDNDNDNSNGNKRKTKTNKVQAEKTFEIFWEAYPNRAAKKQCLAIWKKIDFTENPFPMILEKLEALKSSWGWTKDGGQFIPMSRTWLNREGWHDTIKTEPPKKESEWLT